MSRGQHLPSSKPSAANRDTLHMLLRDRFADQLKKLFAAKEGDPARPSAGPASAGPSGARTQGGPIAALLGQPRTRRRAARSSAQRLQSRSYAKRMKWAALTLSAAAGLALGMVGAPFAAASVSDPLFVFIPTPPPPPAQPSPPPTGYFNGPCGLAVDSSGRFFVSDYYHHAVDVYTSSPTYVTQLAGEDPIDGPCGLALDASNNLYVNNFHRNVAKFSPSPSFGAGTVLSGAPLDSSQPTGVAVDPATGNLYVNDRTYVQEYDSAGTAIQQIGLGNLGAGYGVAVSQYIGGTLGYVYVPDASTNTVKVYDPATSLTTPKTEIKDPFNKPFVSLRDSAIAVDRVTGDIYFADNLQPNFTEKPQAEIYVYSSNNVYKGHLRYNIGDALPPGLAVDNSAGITQGRVYVTSGNTTQAGVYAYPPGAGTFSTPLPPTVSLAMSTGGSGAGAVTASSPTTIDCTSSCETQVRSGAAIDLNATADPGSTFTGWSGGSCAGAVACTVTMDQATSVSATFAAQPSPTFEPQPSGLPPTVPPASRSLPRRHHHRRNRAHHRAPHRRGHHEPQGRGR